MTADGIDPQDIEDAREIERNGIQDKVREVIEEWDMEETGDDECPMCSQETFTQYTSRIVEDYWIRFCSNCHQFEEYEGKLPQSDSLCQWCQKPIKDDQPHGICKQSECNQRFHEGCTTDGYCNEHGEE